MRWEHYQILWLLLAVPALAAFFWWGERVKQKLLTQFVESRLLASLTVGISPGRRKLRYGLVLAAVALLIVTIARLQWGFDLEEVEQRGLDVVVAVDTSKSMLATDIAPNRLQRAKLAALELMQTAKADRLGLVAFAGDAFLSCPLTIDDAAFQQSVQALDVNTIPQGGTALAAAINTALAAFKEKSHYKALVLFTDGEDNDEGAVEAAENAAKAGLKIFTIGIGSAEGTLVTIPTADGTSDYIRDEKGQVLKTKLNEPLLQQIAKITGGFYLPLRGGSTISTLYERGLAPMPKSEGTEKLVKNYHEQFKWPLTAAILLLLAEFFLPERIRKVPPRAAVLAGLVLLFSGASGFASPAGALRDYEAGNYTNALEQFTQLSLVQSNDLRLVFNAGDAAYRATNFDLAEKLFQQVTLSPDLKLQQRAFYNLGNTQFQMAKQAKDLDGLEQGFDAAAKTYERAVALDKNDADAAFNLSYAQKSAEQIRLLKALMRQAKGNADAAVRQRNYHKAVEIMEGLAKYQAAAKQFEDFTKKLKDIDAIATPHQP
ncbi:MAG TPA: VWA domain-containing protein [Candidatus Acidoferrales bacterium]|jgi:Ca-activated chloride channel family protein|nr:VWA domain-containing protein [Candidatus Acidoferrales bacterium]